MCTRARGVLARPVSSPSVVVLLGLSVCLRVGLVINDLPTVESKAPSHFGGVLLASARHAPLAPDKGYNTHDTLSGVHRSLGALI